MGLGGVGITLQDLVQLYAGLARLGTTRPLREIVKAQDHQRDGLQRDPLRLMDKVAAWQVGNVLLGSPPPENGVRNRIAFKTGTSYGYRDAWSVGFDGRITIGVWVGRPDGAPVPGLVGRTAAAPILFDAFARTGKLPMPLPKPPRGALLASNAKLPLPLRRFRPVGELVRTGGEQAPHIQFPLNGSRIDVDRSGGAQAAAMPVKVAGGVLPAPAPGRSAGPGLCPIDRDRRHGRRGHSCHQNSVELRLSPLSNRNGSPESLFDAFSCRKPVSTSLENALTGCRNSGFGVCGNDDRDLCPPPIWRDARAEKPGESGKPACRRA
jgi:penicillin-binding protein 1C